MVQMSRGFRLGSGAAVILGVLGTAVAVIGPVNAAPPWSGIQTISTATSRAYDAPAMAVSRDGTRQVSLWQSTDGGVTTVKSASANLSGGVAIWGPATVVATITTGESSRPDIALSWDGTRATAVWHDVAANRQVIRSASATISGTTQTWGSHIDVYTAAVNGMAEVPKIAVAAGGDLAVVTWYALVNDQYVVMARAAGISSTTQSWEASPQTVSQVGAGGNAYRPVIAMDDDASNVTVAYWVSESNGDGAVKSNSATIAAGPPPTVTWAVSPATLSASSAGGTTDVDIAMSNDGSKAVATWTKDVNGRNIIQSSNATITGTAATWGAATTLSDPVWSAGDSKVTLSNDGSQALAVWWQQTGSTSQVIQADSATISGGSATWSGSTATLSDATGLATAPYIAASIDGSLATVVWSRSETLGSANVVQSSNGYLSSGSMIWSDVANLSSTSATEAGAEAAYGGLYPQVAVSTDGLLAASMWFWYSGSTFATQAIKANGTCTQSWDGSTQCLPGAPTSVGATAGNASAALVWTAPADPYGYGVTEYAVEVVNAGTSAVVQDWTATGSSSPSVSVSGLANGTAYIANVKAINNFGWSATSAASTSFTPVAPSGGSSGTTPTSAPVATPSTTPVASAETESVAATIVAGVPNNPQTPVVLASGLVLVSAEVADRAEPRTVKREPSTTLKAAPVINARAGAPVSLVTAGLTPGVSFTVRIKVDGRYVDLGSALSDAAGVAQLPVFRSSKAGRLTIALVNPATGATTYMKVAVAR